MNTKVPSNARQEELNIVKHFLEQKLDIYRRQAANKRSDDITEYSEKACRFYRELSQLIEENEHELLIDTE